MARRRAGRLTALCWRFATALVVAFFCCLSHSRFCLSDPVSSLVSMFLRVVLGDMAGGWTFEVVMMIGFGREACSRIIKPLSS